MAQSGDTVAVPVPARLKREIDQLATQSHMSPDAVVAEAIEEYLQSREGYVAAIEEALADADRGDFVARADVETWLRSWGTDDERAAPLGAKR